MFIPSLESVFAVFPSTLENYAKLEYPILGVISMAPFSLTWAFEKASVNNEMIISKFVFILWILKLYNKYNKLNHIKKVKFLLNYF